MCHVLTTTVLCGYPHLQQSSGKPDPVEDDLVAALEDIAEPMKKIHEEAEKEGCTLNGAACISLMGDPQWLRDKARKALMQHKGNQ